ncbi:MAG TPA: hypothetical protein VGF29_13955 [Hyphomicrobiaceae bacterium]|jgi:hypothetical protein
MRAVRLVIAVLVGMVLAVAPVSAAFAMASAPHSQAVQAMPAPQHRPAVSVSATDDGCPCCDATRDMPAAVCILKCCSVVAILADVQPWTAPTSAPHADTAVAALSPFSRQPDPPPPRS